MAVGSSGDNLRSLKMIRIMRLFRLFKLVRLLKFTKLVNNLDLDNINPAFIRLFKLLFKIVFTAHLLCCFWFFMASDMFVEPCM